MLKTKLNDRRGRNGNEEEIRKRREKEQKIESQKEYIYHTKLKIIEFLTGIAYRIIAICDKCHQKADLSFLWQELRKKEDNFAISCLHCKHRYPMQLNCKSKSEEIILPLWRPCQVVNKIGKWQKFKPEEIRLESPAIYHSAIFNFGNIRMAFKQAGITYRICPKPDWEMLIAPWLGKLSDYMIGEIVGVDHVYIAQERKKQAIACFDIQKI